ncbi:hypothetical protein A0H81_11681 [Grifola frondosa]|uniref:Uncharacterized protein n=1 Tax=Grifola frondosa TaxID=5627 RepID=A0A1C7LUU0_GRIFR|nr:hypothetical protein A0H81_11681 [Grifola frondosa]
MATADPKESWKKKTKKTLRNIILRRLVAIDQVTYAFPYNLSRFLLTAPRDNRCPRYEMSTNVHDRGPRGVDVDFGFPAVRL